MECNYCPNNAIQENHCKCDCDIYCYLCSDCNKDQINPNICVYCEEHCCQYCYSNTIDSILLSCQRCKSFVCLDCVGICWCQCDECICNKCVKQEDITNCNICGNERKIPICEDGECENC